MSTIATTISTAISTNRASAINSAAEAIRALPFEEVRKIVKQLKASRPQRQPHIAAVHDYDRGACHPVRGGTASGNK